MVDPERYVTTVEAGKVSLGSVVVRDKMAVVVKDRVAVVVNVPAGCERREIVVSVNICVVVAVMVS